LTLPFEIRTLARMALRALIIPDKFKGTLSAEGAAKAIARGWRSVRPDDELRLLPMSDGGDGFGAVLGQRLGARPRQASALDAAHRRCRSAWWWEPKRKTAIVESAAVIGLAMLRPAQRRPFELDTFGLGLLVRSLAGKGARRFLVGIGGSATNDAGFGLARALGWAFLNGSGREIRRWPELVALERCEPPARPARFAELIVAVDVQNRLLGAHGATRVYGPQKGLHVCDFLRAEASLSRLASVVRRQTGKDFASLPGAGAAGGLGFGFAAFAGARLEPGFALFSRLADLERQLAWADLVITGEGSIDRSTLMGKGVGQVVERCRELGLPCLGLGGIVASRSRAFAALRGLTELTGVESAKARPAWWLERLAREVAAGWPAKTCDHRLPG
jgi:glycerate 2-kinase